jgi:hypothetical protein
VRIFCQLLNYNSSTHTDIHAVSSNLGNIGTCGQAQIVSADWDWATLGYNHITHAHATANEYCTPAPSSLPEG